MKRTLFFVGLLALASFAFAQAGAFPGVPAQYDFLILLAIGQLAAFLVTPVTTILKRMGKTKGVTTIVISGVLSALVTGVAGFLSGLYGPGWPGVMNAVVATVTTILSANGLYLTRVQQTRKALEKAFDAAAIEAQAANITACAGCPDRKACEGGCQNLPISHSVVVSGTLAEGVLPLAHEGSISGDRR